MEITAVREENRKYFEPLMPEELWEETDLAFGAIEEDTACGILALAEREAVLTIKYLYVAEKFRQRGIASALLWTLHDIARRTGIDMTAAPLSSGDGTAQIEHCLEKTGFEKDGPGSPIYRTTLGAVAPKLMKRDPKGSARIVPLGEATGRMWNSLTGAIAKLESGEGAVPELEEKSRYDQDTSFLLAKDGEAVGCLLLDRRGEDYILSCFSALKGTTPKDISALFHAGCAAMKQRCGDETEIYINALTGTTEKMVLAMTDDKAEKVGQAVTWYCLY